jgi:4-hydroxy-2-oxoheptanedioate aldolase
MAQDTTLVACFLSSASAAHAEVIATAGFDAVVLDCQHGQLSDADLVPLIRLLERDAVPVVVRVARNAPDLIGRALDAGAAGVIVPLVESVEEAQAAVAATRYPPLGRRSFGPLRAAARGVRSPDEANADVVLAVMIETADGRAAASEIVRVPGVDAVFVGPADLALSNGWTPTLDPAPGSEHERAVTEIAQTAREAGVGAWIAGASPASAQRWGGVGFRFVTVGSDLGLLAAASRTAAGARRA